MATLMLWFRPWDTGGKQGEPSDQSMHFPRSTPGTEGHARNTATTDSHSSGVTRRATTDAPVLARMTTPVTGSPFETSPGIARAFPMEKVAFPEAGEADSGPPSKRRRLDYPAPVAGRLALHAAAWRDITDSAYVLQAVQGYLLDFHTRPPIMSARQANAMETTMSGGKAELLDAVVTELLRKGAIEKCHRGPGFYSRMFLVPKKGGKSRPIINLKPLNRYVRTPHFTMTTLKDVSQLIQPGDWAVCLDLRDAYFHVPVHTRHRRFLQFIWKGQTYRYTALPFGLSTSPFCFTKVTKPVVQYLRSQGVRVVFYLDDVLLLAQTRRGAQENRRRVVHLLGKLGFSLNHEKSDFVPQQSFSYLGLQWDTRSMQVRLPEDKVAEIRSLAASLQDRRIVSARSLMTFLRRTVSSWLDSTRGSCKLLWGQFTNAHGTYAGQYTYTGRLSTVSTSVKSWTPPLSLCAALKRR